MLHIGSTPYTGNYASDGIQLELLDNFCDLGTQIDSKLKFHIHTDTVVKKAYCVLGYYWFAIYVEALKWELCAYTWKESLDIQGREKAGVLYH